MVGVRSIGRRAADLLAQEPLTGSVLACFEHVCDLVTPTGQLLALAWHDMPDGPFLILLDGALRTRFASGTPFAVRGTELSLGQGIPPINLAGGRLYNPQADWAALARRCAAIQDRAAVVADLLAAHPPPLLGEGMGERWLLPACRAIDDILGGYATDRTDLLERGVAALCGLGPGLTPSGDDWLAGWLIGTRIADPAETRGRAAVRRHAPVRTNALSQAFLACAVDGDVDAHWQRLLAVLAWGPDRAVQAAARAILARGATSGADMLAGFLAGLVAPVTLSRGFRGSPWSF